MSSICKFCNKTEIVFDNAFKSKTGKMIPIDKASGVPHNCSENPYNKQQQTQSPQQAQDAKVVSMYEQIPVIVQKLEGLERKIEILVKMVYALGNRGTIEPEEGVKP
jgi:hypothetical protein